jgi:ATP-dependent RNA helicase DeaD
MFINLGSADGLDTGKMLRFICDVADIKGNSIGRMDIKGVYSFIDIDKDVIANVMTSFDGEVFKGRKVRVDLSQGGSGGSSGAGGGSGRSSGGAARSGGKRSYGSSGGRGGERSYGGGDRPERSGNSESREGGERVAGGYHDRKATAGGGSGGSRGGKSDGGKKRYRKD